LHTQQRVWVVLFNIFEFQKSKEEEVYFGELFGFTLDLQKETANLFLLNNFTYLGRLINLLFLSKHGGFCWKHFETIRHCIEFGHYKSTIYKSLNLDVFYRTSGFDDTIPQTKPNFFWAWSSFPTITSD